MNEIIKCPKCGSTLVTEAGSGFRCGVCGMLFSCPRDTKPPQCPRCGSFDLFLLGYALGYGSDADKVNVRHRCLRCNNEFLHTAVEHMRDVQIEYRRTNNAVVEK